MHRASGLFEPGEKTSVVKERWLGSKLPASDPSRSPSVDCNRSGFSFRHGVNVGGPHRNAPLTGSFDARTCRSWRGLLAGFAPRPLGGECLLPGVVLWGWPVAGE